MSSIEKHVQKRNDATVKHLQWKLDRAEKYIAELERRVAELTDALVTALERDL